MNAAWIETKVLEKFLRYVRIETTSDRHIAAIPSTGCQWDLLRLLKLELEELGVTDCTLHDNGYLIARIPGKTEAPIIGFMAHVDTAADAPGRNVDPQLHRGYDGGKIPLNKELVLDPAEFTSLSAYRGDTIITSDGTTLLGADDKAGIAEIMTAVEFLMRNREFSRGGIEIIFTPDEETGKGLDFFPVETLRSHCCYTIDGDEEGTLEFECFNAFAVHIEVKGRVIHPGYARNILVNASTLAAKLVTMLPQNESPETTDGMLGYYCPIELKASLETAEIDIFIRDFDAGEAERRVKVVELIAQTLETANPGARITCRSERQYRNMKEYMHGDDRIIDFARRAISDAGVVPKEKSIRGGTDGARLSERGIPTPNIFSGGHNYHSRFEWIPLSSMIKAVRTILNLTILWSEERDD